MKKPNNPRAFPVTKIIDGYFQDGMTLRDYFAAAALTGIISSGAPLRFASEQAWQVADEMMKQSPK